MEEKKKKKSNLFAKGGIGYRILWLSLGFFLLMASCIVPYIVNDSSDQKLVFLIFILIFAGIYVLLLLWVLWDYYEKKKKTNKKDR